MAAACNPMVHDIKTVDTPMLLDAAPPTKQAATKAKANTVINHLTHRLVTSLLDELDNDAIRKDMMDKVLAPLLRVMYTQVLPYLVVIVGLVLVILVLIVVSCCFSALMFFTLRRRLRA